MNTPQQLARSYDISTKVAQVLQKRVKVAQEHFGERLTKAFGDNIAGLADKPLAATDVWSGWYAYATDFAQRSVLFWDTLRERGNVAIEHNQAGLPPVLHFDFETVVDGRHLARPVNYALVRIVPPEGVTVDPKRRPYVIIDPRAGHGPGIGGFKDDSEVGVALRAGHPVYFVMFYPDPQPGQTMLDVCAAEAAFVRKVRELHPESPKPAIVGNCQGGWAAMMVAASNPDDTGPIVINGAPMSYWGGAWSEGEGDNPMRYAGGNLGGSWLASFAADMGNGFFDGAWLLQNFERLNPANTYWDKYYHLFANVDTEAPRFLDFERWWGGFYLLNREEIEWITQNLFVGNKIWSSGVQTDRGEIFDLRQIKVPIIMFASMGDNITPPQQAFNWVADYYRSSDEIKANGQVIVGLLHKDVGHLGIFVSGKVAKREHTQIVSVLKSIEVLPPGLYGMKITESTGNGGAHEIEVRFEEQRLEEVVARLNRFKRADEKPFEAVEAVSEFNQRAYELFLQPLVRATANEYTAKLGRWLHPLRVQRWAFSDLNPWLAWLPFAARMVKAQRRAVPPEARSRRTERLFSDMWSASLEYYRAMRDAVSEATFFQTYGNLFSLYLADKRASEAKREAVGDARELPVVKEALAAIDHGGYAEALARVASLLASGEEAIPLGRVERKQELMHEYASLLPNLPPEESRRIRGEQDIIVRYAREQALATLPHLVHDPADRERLLALLKVVAADQRLLGHEPRPHDAEVIEAVRSVLAANGSPDGRQAPVTGMKQ